MPPVRIAVKRILNSLLIGLAIGILINEFTFLFLRETARPPQVIELVIPAGTAEGIARGEAPPSIPASMTFVVGDTLLVRNNDSADHELGPLWIPAGSSASLPLDAVQSYAYSCSFQPGNYFGLDVREPLTAGTRLYGILYSGIPLGGLIALYSLIMPAKKKHDHKKDV
ncbi:MAG: hypothetical protein QY332_13080 [Anaerolineales bacterium]|nr:MAG: hypothetical protein QY332_13080 [Anaerolineales bacterium]